MESTKIRGQSQSVAGSQMIPFQPGTLSGTTKMCCANVCQFHTSNVLNEPKQVAMLGSEEV